MSSSATTAAPTARGIYAKKVIGRTCAWTCRTRIISFTSSAAGPIEAAEGAVWSRG